MLINIYKILSESIVLLVFLFQRANHHATVSYHVFRCRWIIQESISIFIFSVISLETLIDLCY